MCFQIAGAAEAFMAHLEGIARPLLESLLCIVTNALRKLRMELLWKNLAGHSYVMLMLFIRVWLASPVLRGSSNNSDNFSFFTRPVLSLSLVTHTHTVTLSNKSVQRTLRNKVGGAFMKHKTVCCRKGMSVVYLIDMSRFLLEISVTVGAVRRSKTKKTTKQNRKHS